MVNTFISQILIHYYTVVWQLMIYYHILTCIHKYIHTYIYMYIVHAYFLYTCKRHTYIYIYIFLRINQHINIFFKLAQAFAVRTIFFHDYQQCSNLTTLLSWQRQINNLYMFAKCRIMYRWFSRRRCTLKYAYRININKIPRKFAVNRIKYRGPRGLKNEIYLNLKQNTSNTIIC